jgi:hypothetical protein
MEEKQPSLEGWEDFAGEYLKADLIKEFPVTLVPVEIDAAFEDGRARLAIKTEYNGKTWKLELNKTNQNFLRANGITSPKAIIGKKLVFDKIKVRNPTTGGQVDSFLIIKVA